MTELISVNEERCIGCNACIRVCPSPEANTVKVLENGKTVTVINNEKCIACGECVKVCKAKARDYDDDTDKFFKDLKERKIIVIAHPSIKTAFPGTWQAVLKWFKQNGADGVYDGSYGADICTWGYVRAIEQGNAKNVISQHCPAVVRYMELYHPDETRDLSPVHSPVSCEAIYIRDFIKKNYAVAVLTPCPAMKLEFESTGHAEYNITFKRLKEYFRRKKIDFNKSIEGDQHYDFDDQVQGCMGGIFPTPGGLRYNLSINMPDIIAVSSDGTKVYKELDEYCELPSHRHPQVFEALSCSGGCGCGCGIGNEDDQTALEIKSIMREVEIDARGRRKTALNGVDKQFKIFDDRINPRSLMRNYESGGKAAPEPSDRELEEVYAKLGKTNEYDRKIDCGACGYKSCAEMAKAIYAGRNIPANCIRCAKASSGGAAPVTVSHPADNGKSAEIAEKVSGFATNLLADIENIYASLYNIDSSNQKSASMSGIVVGILEKVVGFCSSVESIDSDNLPMLVSTLEKLQSAVSSLNENITECANGSATIREAMQAVADATTQLNVMAQDMVSSVSDKY
ncbi:MAG: [Fe-Fe] hydrogenase large subunit C-terminal domain-containing protein [Huintestinicola sp.]|uniref:[Fe-Fe] hydrogenase large subunit C-terminal domain-containing protein n=1 Tax=Huintestinicola sp. TaxID=2981661 RepID=UPI003EFC46EC